MFKARKRTFNTVREVLKRIYRKSPIWNHNQKLNLVRQQSF